MSAERVEPGPAAPAAPLDPHDLIVQLFRDYVADTGTVLPPLEVTRWRELLFAILLTYAGPELPEHTVTRLLDVLAAVGLLDLQTLAALTPQEEEAWRTDPLLVTLATLLERFGFSAANARGAIRAIAEAAAVFHQRYHDSLQLCLRKHALTLLHNLAREIAFSDAEAAREFLTLWLQRTLNMPLPASTPATTAAAAALGVPYDALVEAADAADLHVGLLDDVLRAYLEERNDAALAGQEAEEETP